MIIIAGYELVNAKDRDGYVAAFGGLVSRAREFDGYIHVAITADSVDPERLDSVEVWRDAEALNEWRKRAKAPRMKKPKHSAVRRYDATDGGPSSESVGTLLSRHGDSPRPIDQGGSTPPSGFMCHMRRYDARPRRALIAAMSDVLPRRATSQ